MTTKKIPPREPGKTFGAVTTDKLKIDKAAKKPEKKPEPPKEKGLSFTPKPHVTETAVEAKSSSELKSVYFRVDEELADKINTYAKRSGVSAKEFILIASQILLEKGHEGVLEGLTNLNSHNANSEVAEKLKHYKVSQKALSEVIDPITEAFHKNRSSALKAAILNLTTMSTDNAARLISGRYAQFKVEYPE